MSQLKHDQGSSQCSDSTSTRIVAGDLSQPPPGTPEICCNNTTRQTFICVNDGRGVVRYLIHQGRRGVGVDLSQPRPGAQPEICLNRDQGCSQKSVSTTLEICDNHDQSQQRSLAMRGLDADLCPQRPGHCQISDSTKAGGVGVDLTLPRPGVQPEICLNDDKPTSQSSVQTTTRDLAIDLCLNYDQDRSRRSGSFTTRPGEPEICLKHDQGLARVLSNLQKPAHKCIFLC